MKKYENYREIKKYNSLKDLTKYYNNKGMRSFINVLKYSGKIINATPSNFIYEDKLIKITEYLNNKVSNLEEMNEWDKLNNEVGIINELYMLIYSSDFYLKAENISDSNLLCSYLITVEYFLLSINKKVIPNSVKGDLPFQIKMENAFVNNHPIRIILAQQFDRVCYIADSILRFIIGYKGKNIHHNNKSNRLNTSLLIEYHQSADIRSVIKDVTDNWSFFDFKVKKNDNNFFILMNDNEDDYLDYKIIASFEEYKLNAIQLKYADLLPQSFTNMEVENRVTKYLVKKYLFTDDLSSICVIKKGNIDYKIDLSSLIIVYSSLKEMCIDFKNKNQKYTFNLKDVCLTFKKEDIINKFIDKGIEMGKANLIFELLILNHKHDLFDNPIIPFNNEFLLIPSFVERINVLLTILSLASEFHFRGHEFEKEIISLIKNNGIFATNLKRKECGTTYECDVVFVIDDTLFLCECKAWGLVFSPHDYYEYSHKVFSATEQLDRIANYFSNNLDYVKSKLHYDGIISNVKKIIITLNTVGIKNVINDTQIIDYTSLCAFFNRVGPQMLVLGCDNQPSVKFPGFDEYKGKITKEKFNSFLLHPPYSELSRANLKKEVRCIKIGNKNFIYDDYVDAYNLNTDLEGYIDNLSRYFTKNN